MFFRGKCPALTPQLQLIFLSRTTGIADHMRSLDSWLVSSVIASLFECLLIDGPLFGPSVRPYVHYASLKNKWAFFSHFYLRRVDLPWPCIGWISSGPPSTRQSGCYRSDMQQRPLCADSTRQMKRWRCKVRRKGLGYSRMKDKFVFVRLSQSSPRLS